VEVRVIIAAVVVQLCLPRVPELALRALEAHVHPALAPRKAVTENDMPIPALAPD
jgi:hypothetical protein